MALRNGEAGKEGCRSCSAGCQRCARAAQEGVLVALRNGEPGKEGCRPCSAGCQPATSPVAGAQALVELAAPSTGP